MTTAARKPAARMARPSRLRRAPLSGTREGGATRSWAIVSSVALRRRCRARASRADPGRSGRLAIHDPRGAEPVDAHPETLRPERLREGHLHGAAFGERPEDPLSLRRILQADRDGK